MLRYKNIYRNIWTQMYRTWRSNSLGPGLVLSQIIGSFLCSCKIQCKKAVSWSANSQSLGLQWVFYIEKFRLNYLVQTYQQSDMSHHVLLVLFLYLIKVSWLPHLCVWGSRVGIGFYTWTSHIQGKCSILGLYPQILSTMFYSSVKGSVCF